MSGFPVILIISYPQKKEEIIETLTIGKDMKEIIWGQRPNEDDGREMVVEVERGRWFMIDMFSSVSTE